MYEEIKVYFPDKKLVSWPLVCHISLLPLNLKLSILSISIALTTTKRL